MDKYQWHKNNQTEKNQVRVHFLFLCHHTFLCLSFPPTLPVIPKSIAQFQRP